ncbi:MAG: polyketide cyclase [Gammaproteobacteria bacterium]|nr:polyketide cyclase [Gammaproteobacteria bacterium]
MFATIADVDSWNKWDVDLEFTRMDGAAQVGAGFILKPRGGPRIKIFIEEFQTPARFVDVAQLPLAKMRTVHEFIQSGRRTTIRVTIQTWGPLGFFWRKIVAEKQIRSAAAQTAAFVAYARERFQHGDV